MEWKRRKKKIEFEYLINGMEETKKIEFDNLFSGMKEYEN